ncbi:MAG: Spy/CpxP family protein refolding chaperone, partial [Stellaceae bacterium]
MAAEQPGETEESGAPVMEHHWRHMHHMMMRRMMMGRMMMGRMMMGEMGMRGDPQERCVDRVAWRAARMAYVEIKLDLTAAQRPLWDKVETAAENEQQKEHQLCNDLGNESRSTVIERMSRWQQLLTARLDGLQAVKPAVQALYQALTPEQRAI